MESRECLTTLVYTELILMFKSQLEEQIWTTHALKLAMCRKTACGSLYLKKKKSLKEAQLLSHTEKHNIVRKKEKHLKQTLQWHYKMVSSSAQAQTIKTGRLQLKELTTLECFNTGDTVRGFFRWERKPSNNAHLSDSFVTRAMADTCWRS